MRVALLVALALITTPQHVRGPWLLISVSSLGTVSWRCDPAHRHGPAPGLPGLALGYRAFARGQTGGIRLRAGGRTVAVDVVQPGQTIQLPYLPARVQRLDIWQGGENGTLRATATVDFAPGRSGGYCWPYFPPRVTVTLSPRE